MQEAVGANKSIKETSSDPVVEQVVVAPKKKSASKSKDPKGKKIKKIDVKVDQ